MKINTPCAKRKYTCKVSRLAFNARRRQRLSCWSDTSFHTVGTFRFPAPPSNPTVCCQGNVWKWIMEISDGKRGALVFHLACSYPEALLQPTRDRAGNITQRQESPQGCVSQSGHGPVDLSASGLGLSDTSSLTGGFITIARSCGAHKLNTGLHFLYWLSTATSANSPQPLQTRGALLKSCFMWVSVPVWRENTTIKGSKYVFIGGDIYLSVPVSLTRRPDPSAPQDAPLELYVE